MGFRFRRTIKVAPGVRLNIGKKGISTSVGRRGAGVTFGPKGTTAHVGIPGTGMSYTSKIGSKKQSTSHTSQQVSQPKSSGCGCGPCITSFIILLIICVFYNLYESAGYKPLLIGAIALIVLIGGIALIGRSPKHKNAVQKSQPNNNETNKPSSKVESITIDLGDVKPAMNHDDKTPSQQVSNNDVKEILTVADAAEKVSSQLLKFYYSFPINPREPFTNWKFPSVDLLKKYPSDDMTSFVNREELEGNKNRIISILNLFDIQISSIRVTAGPTITLYEIGPAPGIRISKILNLQDDIALSLAAKGVRIIAPLQGKGTFGIEVPNEHANIISMWSILNSKKFEEAKMELPIALGKTISNEIFMIDLAKIPHLLVAGATGQGKSVGLDAIITSLLYRKHPNELKLVLIDPKKIEFNLFAPIYKHYMAALEENEDEPIITDYSKAIKTLRGLCTLMDQRYEMLKLAKVRNIVEYNKKFVSHQLNPMDGHEFMPYIVVVIDEFGDLIMAKGEEFENPITRIAQLARAVGIHIVMATQRLNNEIITQTIKANFPGRIAYRVGSRVDSQAILDRAGAQQLIGHGDMLYVNGSEPIRVQGAFIDAPEIEAISRFIAEQPGPVEPLLIPDPDANNDDNNESGEIDAHNLDPLFEQAAMMVVLSQQGSTSKIQRQFSIGYNRAGRLMDQLQRFGIVGEAQGSSPREVLISNEKVLKNLLQTLK